MVRRLNTRRPSGTCTRPIGTRSCGGTLVISAPPIVTRPEIRVRRPQMAFSAVVLPAPLAPTRAQIEPPGTCSEMPRSARMLP